MTDDDWHIFHIQREELCRAAYEEAECGGGGRAVGARWTFPGTGGALTGPTS